MFWVNKRKLREEKTDWHRVVLVDSVDYDNDKLFTVFLNKDIEKFLHENFDCRTWRAVRAHVGIVSAIIGYEFEREEDAAAFKLRWM